MHTAATERQSCLKHLPANVRMVLTASAGELNLNQLAQLMDYIMETSPPPNIATINTMNSSLIAQVTDLSQHLDECCRVLSTLSHCPHSPSQAR